ncbi:S8 family serine peptidase [Calothrix sp. UHCC 0171]|uniref:S8 family serine peptidase n=1 Tax=Calothrix sp. UHCC 0171 TaxID=3110245 RepID=UPI002B219262|nr:S8 family serine peptidase [Calothrix sp. UHCC 0171]MEA5572016.1 S8 family serine peptidase [Calothrix sp. UHCC 0171]
MAKITINGVSIDTDSQRTLIASDRSDSEYILIHVNQPLNREQKSQLANLGIEILEYVPENTYICHNENVNSASIMNLPFIEWTNTYLEGFKISPQLLGAPDKQQSTNIQNLPAIDKLSRQPQPVTVVFHNSVVVDDNLRNRLATAARLNPQELEFTANSVRLNIQHQYLEDVTAIAEVRHIEEYVAPQLFNNLALGVINADKTHSIGNFQGEGEIIAIADSGFDRGSTEDVHPAFTGRVLKLYPLGQARAADPDGHGTHVAGSVLGDGFSEKMGGAIRGAAPKAKLVLQSVLDVRGGLGGIPNDLNDLFKVPYNDDHARVHTNSWGASKAGKYDLNCQQVDKFVWENRDIVICFAAGNDGRDRDNNGIVDNGSISSPGSAKNCITVGATENNRPDLAKPYKNLFRYQTEPIASDGWSDNPEGMAAFSSRGPTMNERIKPDVVAPGSVVLSTCSRNAQIDAFYGKSEDQLYAFLSGTSMATPLVAGCAAVVREYLQKQYNHQPSAALVKAMLINGAKDIVGQYVPSEAGEIPNYAEGFGRVDLAATVAPRGDTERVTFQDEKTTLETGEEEKTEVEIAETDSLLKVTLVWTDFPGEALQNDLDLILRTADGQERHGNMPATSTEFDRKNNIEQVIWTDVPAGKAEAIVRAFRIVQEQSYALVVRVT